MKLIGPILAAALLWATGAAAAERTAAFEAMLQRMPAALVIGVPHANIVFQDFRVAAEVSLRGQPPPAPGGDRPPLAPHYFRLLGAAFGNAMSAGVKGEWQSRVGFGPDDIESVMTFARPPTEIVLLDLDDRIDHAGIGSVLLAHDYVTRDLPGWTAWIRGEEDFRVDLPRRDVADPFGGHLGRSSRVASDGSLLVYATAWPMLEFIAAAPGDPLAEDRPMRALLTALADPRFGEAKLAQVVILNDPWPAFDPAALRPGGAALPEPATVGLARWQLGLFADLSTGTEDIAVAAFAYPSRRLAEAMAARLEATWGSARPPSRPDFTFADLVEGEAEIFVAGDGPAAVVLAVRRDMSDTEEGRNLGFNRLYDALVRRDLIVFGVE